MATVTELFDSYPVEDSVIRLSRNEALLLTRPQLPPILKLQNHEPLQTVHFPLDFVPKKFAPPLGVYECDFLRLEWQQMAHTRQPFYHRNLDVDELSYQVCGERTLKTENGVVELRPGDFARIPVGVAHDNYGRDEIHLIFYIPAPVKECLPSTRVGAKQIPAFEGWSARPMPELSTECLGGPDCDVVLNLVDETMLLEHADGVPESDRIQVIKPEGSGEQEWLYKSKDVWIAYRKMQPEPITTIYRRHRRAEEIQCQISGERTLITQRGILVLQPGDFVNIPSGVAFTELVQEGVSEHISVLTRNVAIAKSPFVKTATPATPETLAQWRK